MSRPTVGEVAAAQAAAAKASAAYLKVLRRMRRATPAEHRSDVEKMKEFWRASRAATAAWTAHHTPDAAAADELLREVSP